MIVTEKEGTPKDMKREGKLDPRVNCAAGLEKKVSPGGLFTAMKEL